MIHVDRVSPRRPAAWIAALCLDDSERYILVTRVHSNPQRGIVHGAVDQLLLGLLRLMLQRATRAKSPGTPESADAAAIDVTPEAGAGQSTLDRQPE